LAVRERDGVRRVLTGVADYREVLAQHSASRSMTTSSRASPPPWRPVRQTRRYPAPSTDGKTGRAGSPTPPLPDFVILLPTLARPRNPYRGPNVLFALLYLAVNRL
jgi:hypothetical protein